MVNMSQFTNTYIVHLIEARGDTKGLCGADYKLTPGNLAQHASIWLCDTCKSVALSPERYFVSAKRTFDIYRGGNRMSDLDRKPLLLSHFSTDDESPRWMYQVRTILRGQPHVDVLSSNDATTPGLVEAGSHIIELVMAVISEARTEFAAEVDSLREELRLAQVLLQAQRTELIDRDRLRSSLVAVTEERDRLRRHLEVIRDGGGQFARARGYARAALNEEE